MQREAPLQLDLKRPPPVLLFYLTAMVMPDEREPRFTEDINGHDARLERALGDLERAGARPGP